MLLLVFGATNPQLGDALGKGIRNFKKASDHDDDAIDVSPKDAEHGQLPTGTQSAAAQSTAQSKKA